MPCQFIIYACPLGELGHQLESYFQITLANCGANAAHKYMPHCTLTGFFVDELRAVPLYLQTLGLVLTQTLQTCAQPAVTINQISFQPNWHGLEIQSPWLKQLIANFASTVSSATLQETIRLKDWLHLSLAYEFDPEQHDTLIKVAQETINLQASVQWELRFYQRHPDWSWTCHRAWLL